MSLVKPSMSLRHGSATTIKLSLSREFNEESLVRDYTLSSPIVLKRSRFELDLVTFNIIGWSFRFLLFSFLLF